MEGGERVAVLEAEVRAHLRSDDERNDRIEKNTTEIKDAIRDLSKTLTEAVQRIHGRIDDEATTRTRAIADVESRADKQRIYNLTYLLGLAGSALLWLVDRLGVFGHSQPPRIP